MNFRTPLEAQFDPLDDIDPALRPIMLWLKDIGHHAASDPLGAIKRTDAALFSYPEEPVFYLRRIDLISENAQLVRNSMGLDVFIETKKMLDKLDALSESKPLFALIGNREKKQFSYLMGFCDLSNWLDLLRQTQRVAAAYFPDTRDFGKHDPARPKLASAVLPPAILQR